MKNAKTFLTITRGLSCQPASGSPRSFNIAVIIMLAMGLFLGAIGTKPFANINVFGDSKAATFTTAASFVRHLDLTFGASNLGPTAPIPLCNGSFCGLGFDADAEQTDLIIDIPEAWDGVSDLTLEITWTNEATDAIADTEDVDLDIEFRSISRTGETTSQGTAVVIASDYTQSGSGTDGELFSATFLIDFDGATQPVSVDDLFLAIVTRDVTGESNSYSGDAILGFAELIYNSTNAISSH